nr:MAG TPA: hypothetical protein [Caudoviricetes sp.]
MVALYCKSILSYLIKFVNTYFFYFYFRRYSSKNFF